MEEISELREIEELYNEEGYDYISKSLKKKRAELHPDKNGNQFSSAESEKQYHFLDQAINHIDKIHSERSQLVSMSEVTKLMETLSKSLLTRNVSVIPTAKEFEKSSRESIRSELSRKYKGKKIGSGVVATFLGYMITQTPNLEKNPILKPFFSDPIAIQVMLILSLFSAFLFVVMWIKESKDESLSTYMLSESPLHEIFEILKKMTAGDTITSKDITIAVVDISYRRRRFSPFYIFFGSMLCASTIDHIVETQTQRLIERKVIKKIDIVSIDRTYKILA